MRTITLAIAIAFSCAAFAGKINVPNTQAKPLSFIENRGQIIDQYGALRNDIDIKLETPGMNVFVGGGTIHYQWYKYSGTSVTSPSATFEGGRLGAYNKPVQIETYRMDVELAGANKNAEVVLEEQQEYRENYYLPQCAGGAVARTYNRISYKDVYPGIDWVLYSKNNQLKYDFVVHAGADPKQIRIKYEGATRLSIAEGALHAETPFGSVVEAAPFSYRANNGAPIPTTFVLEGNVLRFSVPVYEGDFVIDPVLNWATYYGGSGDEECRGVTADTVGNGIATGFTVSSGNIATTGAYQVSYAGNRDGWVAKFNTSGVRQWATYYGGSGDDEFRGIACTPAGDVYVGGITESSGLATSGSHQPFSGGYQDGLLVKLTATGLRVWASYYGGVGDDEITDIAVATNGNLVICGHAASANGIATPGTHLPTKPMNGNGFCALLNSSGTRLWGTYYDIDHFFSVATDGFGNIYGGGNAGPSNTNAATTGSHQAVYMGPISQWNGVLVKFNSSGQRQWGTFYGGTADAHVLGVTTDGVGDVYICGQTTPSSGIATTGSHQATSGGALDGFIAKFNPSGVRQWGSYYGGSAKDFAAGIEAGPDNNIYVSGGTYSSGAIATAGAYQAALSGAADAYLAVFNQSGSRLWGSYFGGPGYDWSGMDVSYWAYCGAPLACSPKGQLYMAALTYASGAGVATTGAHQTTYGGSWDGVVVQFQIDPTLYLLNTVTNLQLCKGDSMTVMYGVSSNFAAGNTFTLQLSNSSGSFASPTTLATINGIAGGTVKIPVPLSAANGSGYRMRIVASNPAKTSNDNGLDITISQYPLKPVATVNNPVCTGDSIKLGVAVMSGVTWSWTGPNSFTANIQNPGIANVTTAASGDYIVAADLAGCARKDTVTVSVGTTPAKPSANNNSPVCAGATLNLTAMSTTPGVSYSWSGPMGYSSTQQNPNIAAATPGHAGAYIVTATLGSCHAKDTTTAIINSVSSLGAYASPNDTFCTGTQVSFVAVPFNGGTSPQYQWHKNGTAIPGATNMVYSTTGTVTGDSFYCRMIVTGICVDPLELYSPGIKVTVLSIISTPSATISSNPATPQPGQLTAFTATSVNGGQSPTYQWLRNGQPVIGATSAIWSASTLHPYDQISCVVFSSDPCADPKTDTSSMIVVNFPTSVKNIDGKNWRVYPNPATNELTIEGDAGVSVSIVNVLGQEVYTGILTSSKEVINISQYAPGNYILQLTGSDGSRHVVKVEKQ